MDDNNIKEAFAELSEKYDGLLRQGQVYELLLSTIIYANGGSIDLPIEKVTEVEERLGTSIMLVSTQLSEDGKTLAVSVGSNPEVVTAQ